MSFYEFLKTHRVKLSSLDDDFAEFIDDYFDDPEIQGLYEEGDIKNYLFLKDATEEIVESFVILFNLYKRTEQGKKGLVNQD